MLLSVEKLSASIGAIHILHEVDIHVDAGETVCLIGANGAGKSTMMRSIAGLLRPVRGRVLFAGEDVAKRPASEIVRFGIALVPEGRRVFSPLTVRENLRMGAFSRGNDPEIAKDFERVLELFPKLAQRIEQPAGTMSGGEQQMLAIGRALMSRPKLLLLDEPSLGLAPKIVSEIFGKIGELARLGTAVLIAEQNATMALKLSSRGYLLSHGRAVLSATKEQLVGNEAVQSAYLGV